MIKKTNGFLEEYVKKSKNGEILICQSLSIELNKLMSDMNSDEYIYDTTDADKRINFIEKCVRLTKSPFYGQPMKLFLFQKAFLSALYGFKMKDGSDRFQRALFVISRKNGKSQLCSALGLTELVIGGTGMDIVCSSNDDMQADILYQATDEMREMIDPESVDTWRNQKGIKCFLNNNKIFKLSERTRNKEGRNIDFAIIDEIHEMKENTIVKAIEQSQSLKINPKLILITTEGMVNNGVLDNEMKRARGIISGEIMDKASARFLPWIYEQDSESEVWEGNEQNGLWTKSNPTLGVVKKYSYLEQQVDLARYSKSDRVFVLSKDFNLKQSNAEAWLKQEDVEKCSGGINLEEFRNSLCLIGTDLAETTDLSATTVLFLKPNDPKKYISTMFFIPDGKLTRADDRGAGARYEEWANSGLVRILEGNYIDTSRIADWYYELYERYGIKPLQIGYDSRFASEFIHKAEYYGFDSVCINQRPEVLTRGIRAVEADIQSNQIVGLDEVSRWCLNNASLKVDGRGFCMLEKIKGQPSRRIDGALSLVMAYEMLFRNSEYKEHVNASIKVKS